MTLTDVLNVSNVYSAVSLDTGDVGSSLSAAGYAAFVQSVTGSVPTVLDLGNNHARIVLTADQISKLQAWVKSQVSDSVSGKDAPLDFNLGPILFPLALQYVLPVVALLAVTGFIVGRYVK